VLGRGFGARRALGRILLKRREILRKRGRVRRSAVALRFVRRAGSEAEPVKLIIAIIQPNKLESVKEALSEVEVFRLTVLDVQGFGRQRGHAETYRGHEIAVNLLRKVQLQIAVNDEFVEPTIAAIVKGGRTGERGEIGDGKIFVLPMDECVRIRTGERGSEAI
jgi:nitrogen regulatory protein P-II 1